MCIGIPMQVREPLLGMAVCEGRGKTERIDMMLVGELPVGGWILAFNGKAVRVLEADEAARIDMALDTVEKVMAGQAADVDTAFADIVGRTPQLPPHLRRPQ
ncbi:MAG: HypC/HybG/HupF family hydrogenase formation chaperone [Burkholderiaceae bacterium]